MRDLVFPARKKYSQTKELAYSGPLLEIYTNKELTGKFLTSLGRVAFTGGAANHYLVQWSEQVLNDLLSSLDMPEPVEKHLSSLGEKRKHKPPKIMAVANITPDSFYAGSRIDVESGALQGIIDATPDIIDVGGESTRPGSMEISVSEEIGRLKPVMDYLGRNSGIPISLDTRHHEVLEEFAGQISYINDITGFRDKRMIGVATGHGLKCITMHMRGEPGNMQSLTRYTDVLPEVLSFLIGSAENLREAGIDANDIFLDPGIGFAKDFNGNLDLVRDAGSFNIGYGTLFGTSRKSFLGKITGNDTQGRLSATLATTAYLAWEGVHILRVHDTKENSDVVKVISKILETGN